MENILTRPPDVYAVFTFNGTRKHPAADGYRPMHRISADYLTTGMHHYEGMQTVPVDGTARGTITFLSPEAYPYSLRVGQRLPFQEGERIVGYVTILEILNPLLAAPEPN